MDEKPQTYRPSAFKLPNKKHKTGQHRSKREISRDTKGFGIRKLACYCYVISGKKDVKALTTRRNQSLSRNDRRNQIQQIREHKRDTLLAKSRQQGGAHRPPLLTVILLPT